jgi:arylformamidase
MLQDIFANMTMVDLTFPITDGMPIWSGEPRCIVRDWFVLDRTHGSREPLNMKFFCMAGHQGTHTDAPYHFNYEGYKLSDIPLSRYMGWCKVLDFTEKKLGDHFVPDDFERRGVKTGDRILICTGWDRYFNPFDPLYFDLRHPHFSAEAIDWVLQRRLQLIGMDVPSTDPRLEDHPKIFRERENYPIILELMTNLDKIIGKEVYLMALPLNVKDGDGSWVRAVAFVPNH